MGELEIARNSDSLDSLLQLRGDFALRERIQRELDERYERDLSPERRRFQKLQRHSWRTRKYRFIDGCYVREVYSRFCAVPLD
jgi:hypothetical protein